MTVPTRSRRTAPASVRELMDGLHRTIQGFRQMTLAPVARAGVTPAQFWVLNHLHDTGELACGPLASKLGVTLPSVTSLIDPIEKAGFVRRTRSAKDRRVVRLEITPRGSALLRRVWKELEREVSLRVRELDPADVRSAARVLAVLGRRVEPATPGGGGP
ncbi:MAG: MarR family transcriptional regulator [Thermoplasmata archaeon]|nr:MarR family transcriptional regulator [Thermoplasmata archaeon]